MYSLNKGPVTRKIFPFDDAIMVLNHEDVSHNGRWPYGSSTHDTDGTPFSIHRMTPDASHINMFVSRRDLKASETMMEINLYD